MIASRRSFLGGLIGLIAAPAIVKAELLMPVKGVILPEPNLFIGKGVVSPWKMNPWFKDIDSLSVDGPDMLVHFTDKTLMRLPLPMHAFHHVGMWEDGFGYAEGDVYTKDEATYVKLDGREQKISDFPAAALYPWRVPRKI